MFSVVSSIKPSVAWWVFSCIQMQSSISSLAYSYYEQFVDTYFFGSPSLSHQPNKTKLKGFNEKRSMDQDLYLSLGAKYLMFVKYWSDKELHLLLNY